MPGGFALVVQRLPRVIDQVLVLCEVAGLRAESSRFAPSDVLRLFDTLRLPRPGNVNDAMSRLKGSKHLTRLAVGGSWSVTPEGRQHVLKLIEGIDLNAVAVAEAGSPGATLGSERQPVIDPMFAPPRWSAGIARLLERFPFESNVFCMTRFPGVLKGASALDPVASAIPVLREAMTSHGLTLHLASDRQVDDELFGNVAAFMWACHYGIGIVEDRAGKGLNYNVGIELGGMLMAGRRCAILKDRSSPSLPTDLVGHIYKSVDLDHSDEVAAAAHLWVAEDLGLGRCPSCPSAATPEATVAGSRTNGTSVH